MQVGLTGDVGVLAAADLAGGVAEHVPDGGCMSVWWKGM
jgi:hypothetical protein